MPSTRRIVGPNAVTEKRLESDWNTRMVLRALYRAAWVAALALGGSGVTVLLSEMRRRDGGTRWGGLIAVLLGVIALAWTLAALRRRVLEQSRALLRQQEQLEEQATELEEQAAELEVANEDLLESVAEADRARARAEEVAAEQRALIDAITDIILVLDADGHVIRIPQNAPRLLRGSAAALVGRHVRDLVTGDWAPVLLGAIREALATRQKVELEYAVMLGAEAVWLAGTVSALSDVEVLWVARNITERRLAEEALRASEARYRLLFDYSPRPMWVYDVETLRFLAVNDAAVSQYGYDRDEFLRLTLRDIRPREDVAAMEGTVAAMGDGYNPSGAWRHRRQDGSLLDVEITSHALTFEGRRARLVLINDVTARQRAEAAVEQSLALVRATLEATADGILAVDQTGRFTGWNRKFAELWRIPSDAMPGKDSDRALAAVLDQLPDPAAFLERVREIDADPSAESFDVIECTDGRVVECYSTLQRVGGAVAGRVFSFRDVTGRRALEAKLAHQAFHDTLTGLANRAQFRTRVEHALARADRAPERVAVLFLDLDHFKAVNDGYGHAAGDRLLELVAERLLDATRGSDTVARLGGDEFAILLTNVRVDADAERVAERVIGALRAPFTIAGREVTIGTSVGIARAVPAQGPDELLRNADTAMYAAKSAGKGGVRHFEPAMQRAILERVELETDLRRAVCRGEFVLIYQPIVELDTGRVTAVEALVRWLHPRRGLLPPSAFITLAEETGLIVPLGRWALGAACREVAGFTRAAGAAVDLTVTVNLSGRQLEEPQLVEDVATALRDAGLAPDRLVLEITESVLMRDTDATLARLRALKALGVRLAVDDFGTGYSSLAYLQRFPVDVLKIDKGFVAGLDRDEHDAALVRTIVALGEMLGLPTVAEGIERVSQREHLLALGCALGQGFLYAAPQSGAAIPALLREENRQENRQQTAGPGVLPRDAAARRPVMA